MKEAWTINLLQGLMMGTWISLIMWVTYSIGANRMMKRNVKFRETYLFIGFLATMGAIPLGWLESALPFPLPITPLPETGTPVAIQLFDLMALLYVMAICWRFFRLGNGWFRFSLTERHTRNNAPQYLHLFMREQAARMGIRKPVTLGTSSRMISPLTYGYWKPVILIPAALLINLPPSGLEALILHELRHIARKDYLHNLFYQLTETLFFFNPFVRLMVREARLLREIDCDRHVLDSGYAAIPYAENLLRLARTHQLTPAGTLGISGNQTPMHIRISNILHPGTTVPVSRTQKAIWMVPLLLLMPFSGLFRNPGRASTQTAQVAVQLPVSHVSTNPGITVPVPKYGKPTPLVRSIRPRQEKQPVAQAATPVHDGTAETETGRYPLWEAGWSQSPRSHEVTLVEEDSKTGSTSKSVYKLTLENGQWRTRLLWMVTETPANADSTAPAGQSRTEAF